MDPDQWRRWLRRYGRGPEDRLAFALETVDAFEALSAGGSTDDRALQSIVKAASSPHQLVFNTGCSILVQLAVTREDCRQAIDRIASSPSWTVRFHAVAYLEAALPESLLLSVIDRALSDRSARVREKAVEQAERLGLRHLLPRLEAMMASESQTGVQECLVFHVPLLRDGFHLEPVPEGSGYRVYVSIPLPRWPGLRELRGITIPADRFTDSYLRETVERLKKGEKITY